MLTSLSLRATRMIALAALCALGAAGAASAQDDGSTRAYAGSTGLFVNDALGDGRDRWQSASHQRSFFFAGAAAGEAVELRARAQIVSPWTPSQQQGPDRPYSIVLGFGLFHHGAAGPLEFSMGGELVLQGDQTGLPRFQSFAHDALGLENSYDPSRDDPHVPDRLTARTEFELGHRISFDEKAMLRPYGRLVAGADRKAMLGADLVLGAAAAAPRAARDVTTGQFLPQGAPQGFSLIAGADISFVDTSMHIPEDSAVAPEDIQTRLRLGVEGNLGAMRIFAGQAWLGPQFSGQAEPQRVGLLSVNFAF
jgi:uncharacterized protein YfiM (DUF2279 family)